MTDVFKDLPTLKWRGIEVPIAQRTVSFEQELAMHKYAYRDDELLESLGRHNWRFEYTIPFREDIRKGPYRNLYVATFSTFLQACRDRSEGALEDPILGQYTARCQSVSVQTDVNKRDGEDLQVTFIHSPALDENEATGALASGLPGAVQEGLRIGDALPRYVLVQDPILEAEIYVAIEEYDAGLDALEQIIGFGAQLTTFADRIDSTIAQYEHKINKLTSVLDKIDQKLLSPENAPINRSLRRLGDSLLRLGKKTQPGREVLTTVLLDDMTPMAAAVFLSNTIEEFTLLNPNAPLPLIPSGTKVSYFAKGTELERAFEAGIRAAARL